MTCKLGCTSECKAKLHGCPSECPSLPWQPQAVKCNFCRWVGGKHQMSADYTFEAYSNTVCPECGMWDDYTEDI